MSLSGRLDDLQLPPLLQLLCTNRKSGRLSLSRRDGYGVVVLHDGAVVYAATHSVRETLGNLLVSRGLVTERQLSEALEQQHREPRPRRLGRILVEMGAVAPASLSEVLRAQIGTVLAELLSWREGHFRFDEAAEGEAGEAGFDVEVDFTDFLSSEGMTADDALLEATRRRLDASEEEKAFTGQVSGQLTVENLRALKQALRTCEVPLVTAELTREILDFAAEILPRSVLFAVRRDEVRLLGSRRSLGPPSDFRLPLSPGSLLADAIERQTSYRGPIPEGVHDDRLLAALGGGRPQEVVVIPMQVAGRTVLILYGDDLPEQKPFGPLEGLELLMLQTGLALERGLLERKLAALAERVPDAAAAVPDL